MVVAVLLLFVVVRWGRNECCGMSWFGAGVHSCFGCQSCRPWLDPFGCRCRFQPLIILIHLFHDHSPERHSRTMTSFTGVGQVGRILTSTRGGCRIGFPGCRSNVRRWIRRPWQILPSGETNRRIPQMEKIPFRVATPLQRR